MSDKVTTLVHHIPSSAWKSDSEEWSEGGMSDCASDDSDSDTNVFFDAVECPEYDQFKVE